MVKNFSKIKLILMVLFTMLAVILLTSACNMVGGEQETTGGPKTAGILAPLPLPGETMVKSLMHGPVQIQSGQPGQDISRVELWVKEPNQETDKLVRSDVPIENAVIQEWTPQQPGVHTIKVKTFRSGSQTPTELSLQIRVIDSQAVKLAVAAVAQTGAEFTALTPTPAPAAVTPDAQISVVQEGGTPTAVPTPVRRYPPPPPAPGVPPGPTRAELPDFGPPVCDAAKYVDMYTGDTSRRVMVIEADDVPAIAVGGTLVHRAWRVQNIGTCTWGPGYELSFYGGRAMGSGGVAFEANFPSDPGRRNTLIDNNRLIAPQGKPNQIAVLEVLLETPVTPGIHQSYWRMRNPQGVYFGPIMGVTLEVVRECKSGIYGAPVINKFEILGVGSVYQPDNPVIVQAKYGDAVTLEWNIINADNFDVVMEDPTGNIQSTTTPDPSGRATFTPKTLGRHTITLYADNGSCTVTAQVFIDVVPNGNQFQLDLILSSNSGLSSSSNNNISYSSVVSSNAVRVEWHHYDTQTDQFNLYVQSYKRTYSETSASSEYWWVITYIIEAIKSIFSSNGNWSDWVLKDQLILPVGGEGDSQGAATITNVERRLCPAYDSTKEEYGLRYTMEARKDNRPATPQFSNAIDVKCTSQSSGLPTEIQGAGSSSFNP